MVLVGWQSMVLFMFSSAVWFCILMAVSPDGESKCSPAVGPIQPDAGRRPGVDSPVRDKKAADAEVVPLRRAARLLLRLCPRYHRNVAVVMPFIKGQVPDLVANLQEWIQHVPCSRPTLAIDGGVVRLLFYFNNERDVGIEQEILAAWEKVKTHPLIEENGTKNTPRVGDCFSHVSFLWGNLGETAHNHDKGTGVMFRSLFPLVGALQVHYFFLMEPDCFPIRDGWLDRIRFESVCGSDFWVKGSSFRNAHQPQFDWASHINGNALYNSGDEDFVALVDSIRRDQGPVNYDVGLYRMVMVNGSLGWRKPHRYIHTDMIYNYGNRQDFLEPWQDWNDEDILLVSPDTYLVHGRHSWNQSSAIVKLINSVVVFAMFMWVGFFLCVQIAVWVRCRYWPRNDELPTTWAGVCRALLCPDESGPKKEREWKKRLRIRMEKEYKERKKRKRQKEYRKARRSDGGDPEDWSN